MPTWIQKKRLHRLLTEKLMGFTRTFAVKLHGLSMQCRAEYHILPYFGKRKQVTKFKFLVKERNVSVISTEVNFMMSYLTYLSSQEECL